MNLKYEHLIGQQFDHGTQDCYEIQRQFWKDNFDLDLPPYARPDDWWDHGQDLYRDHYAECGFEVMDITPIDLQPADVFLIAIRSEVPNHSGIHLGDGQMLHHFYGRLSEVTAWDGMWRNRTCAILRHKSLLNWKPEHVEVELQSIKAPTSV